MGRGFLYKPSGAAYPSAHLDSERSCSRNLGVVTGTQGGLTLGSPSRNSAVAAGTTGHPSRQGVCGYSVVKNWEQWQENWIEAA